MRIGWGIQIDWIDNLVGTIIELRIWLAHPNDWMENLVATDKLLNWQFGGCLQIIEWRIWLLLLKLEFGGHSQIIEWRIWWHSQIIELRIQVFLFVCSYSVACSWWAVVLGVLS